MSAKDARALVWSLYQRPGTPLQFEEALDDYVHQLAQEIRTTPMAHDYDPAEAIRLAADLIDPASPYRGGDPA